MMGQVAESNRMDAFILAISNPDMPIPFWPMDFPVTLQGSEEELPYQPPLVGVIDSSSDPL
jgi:hypothetical protein